MEKSKNNQNKLTAGLLSVYLFVLTWIILFKMQFSFTNIINFSLKGGLDLEEWISLVGNVGFPIVVAFYLLIRFEKKIDSLTEAINKMADIIEKEKRKD